MGEDFHGVPAHRGEEAFPGDRGGVHGIAQDHPRQGNKILRAVPGGGLDNHDQGVAEGEGGTGEETEPEGGQKVEAGGVNLVMGGDGGNGEHGEGDRHHTPGLIEGEDEI